MFALNTMNLLLTSTFTLLITNLCIKAETPTTTANTYSSEDTIRFVGGSCIYQNSDDQPLWEFMKEDSPDVLLFLGDNIYLDQKPGDTCMDTSDDLSCFAYSYESVDWYKSYIDVMEQYNNLLTRDDFNYIRNVNTTILSIWDDHDYGKDNEDKLFEYRNYTRDGFIYFWNTINMFPNNTNSTQNNGTPGSIKNNRVQSVIDDLASEDRDLDSITYYYDMQKGDNKIRIYGLDSRWYKLTTGNITSTILGEKQKSWLLNITSNDTTMEDINFHIFLCGSNMLSKLNLEFEQFEIWPNNDKEWFYKFLRNRNIANKSMLISGDIHYSMINKDKIPTYDNITDMDSNDNNSTDDDNDFTFYEIVTSSMTHSLGETTGKVWNSALDDEYSAIPLIYENNYVIIDIGLNGWNLSYIGYRNDMTKRNVILTAKYNFNNYKFEYKIKDDDSTAEDDEIILYIIIGACALALICCCCAVAIWWCCKHRGYKKAPTK